MNELWKEIKGYKKYSISNLGRVKSYMCKNEVIMKSTKDKDGYETISIGNNPRKTFKVHRLVALHFIENVDNKFYINHKDLNKSNNYFNNLEWCTHKENLVHASKQGAFKSKKRLDMHKSREKKVLMSSLSDEPLLWFDSIQEASKQENFLQSKISSCCNGDRKSHGGYKWSFYYEH